MKAQAGAGGANGGTGGVGGASAGGASQSVGGTAGGTGGGKSGASGSGMGGTGGAGNGGEGGNSAGAGGAAGAKSGAGGTTGGAGGTAAGMGGATSGGGGVAGTGGLTGGAAGKSGAGATAGTGGGGAAGQAGSGAGSAGGKGGSTGIVCGNGIAEFGEQCDGLDLKGKPCEQAFPFTKGYLTCSPTCEFVAAQCTPVPGCGDGKVNGTDQCDGNNLGEATCATVLGDTFAKGTLTCNPACELDATGCYVPDHCGDGKVNLPEEECDGPLPQGASCRTFLGENYSASETPKCTPKCRLSFATCTPTDGHDGPPTVQIQMGSGGATASAGIHATEVTRAQYAKFLEATGGVPPSGTSAECASNATLMPLTSCMAMADVCKLPGSGCAKHPQVCVGWCDAAAFCSFAGKRLCAGPSGNSIPITAWSDAAQDVWYATCSSNDKYKFAYGSSFVPGTFPGNAQPSIPG